MVMAEAAGHSRWFFFGCIGVVNEENFTTTMAASINAIEMSQVKLEDTTDPTVLRLGLSKPNVRNRWGAAAWSAGIASPVSSTRLGRRRNMSHYQISSADRELTLGCTRLTNIFQSVYLSFREEVIVITV